MEARAKSFLIDTVIKGFPIPIIFLRDLKPDLKSYSVSRDVVDGQQRLRTLISYIIPDQLRGFDPEHDDFKLLKAHNPEYAGKAFSELPKNVEEEVLDYQFSVNVFPLGTDDRMLSRSSPEWNSTGYKLSKQELRNAEFYGEFKQTMYALANEQLNRWREWGVFNANQLARMLAVELTSELTVYMMEGQLEKSDKRIDKAYEDNELKFPLKAEVQRRYRHVFDAIDEKIGVEDMAYFKKRTVFSPC